MAFTDEIMGRMKHNYEEPAKFRLIRRTPVMIRIDGKAFHTWTRNLKRPFDDILSNAMRSTMKHLCENIQGCVLGYTQSDEITLVLVDYQTLTSGAWFDYEVQKMCSIAASMATNYFNKTFRELSEIWIHQNSINTPLTKERSFIGTENLMYYDALCKCVDVGAMFDARCFNVPKEEVTNNLYARQADATRNSIQMLGRAHFSHSRLQGKSCSQIQDMLVLEKGINWNDLPTMYKRGSCSIKTPSGGWVIDTEIPVFKEEGRNYVESRIHFEGEE